MKRKAGSRRDTERSPGHGALARLPLRQIGVVFGVLILVGVVLFLKTRQSPSASAEPASVISAEPTGPVEPASSPTVRSAPPIADTPEPTSTRAPSPTPTLLPERQLNRLLEAREPVFLFFHSNSCTKCIEMTEIIEDVYRDFAGSVALVDVDVYDERNKSLLQRAQIRAIPSLVFVDRAGEVGGHVGVMEADALREQLTQLGGE